MCGLVQLLMLLPVANQNEMPAKKHALFDEISEESLKSMGGAVEIMKVMKLNGCFGSINALGRMQQHAEED